jgi:hypothetical protein
LKSALSRVERSVLGIAIQDIDKGPRDNAIDLLTTAGELLASHALSCSFLFCFPCL